MRVLASIYPQDVNPRAVISDYSAFKTRLAGRAVVFDGVKVALVKVGKHGYYMLPGGGLDDDDIETGTMREILEELGVEVKLDKEIGMTEVFFDRWRQRQVDYCFTAHLIHANAEKSLTDFEIEEGYEIVWAVNIDEAIKLVEAAIPEQTEGKLVCSRSKILAMCQR